MSFDWLINAHAWEIPALFIRYLLLCIKSFRPKLGHRHGYV